MARLELPIRLRLGRGGNVLVQREWLVRGKWTLALYHANGNTIQISQGGTRRLFQYLSKLYRD